MIMDKLMRKITTAINALEVYCLAENIESAYIIWDNLGQFRIIPSLEVEPTLKGTKFWRFKCEDARSNPAGCRNEVLQSLRLSCIGSPVK